mmetsp:Transcript_72566/g.132939  ORF Transcript_72566/g.132939 Transcript_72566/m.132939 type:complete len:329 (+) Transcript_72566:79-1065(+)
MQKAPQAPLRLPTVHLDRLNADTSRKARSQKRARAARGLGSGRSALHSGRNTVHQAPAVPQKPAVPQAEKPCVTMSGSMLQGLWCNRASFASSKQLYSERSQSQRAAPRCLPPMDPSSIKSRLGAGSQSGAPSRTSSAGTGSTLCPSSRGSSCSSAAGGSPTYSCSTGRRMASCGAGSRSKHKKALDSARAVAGAACKIQRLWRELQTKRRVALARLIYAEARKRRQQREASEMKPAWTCPTRMKQVCRDVLDAVKECSRAQRALLAMRAAAHKRAHDNAMQAAAATKIHERMQRQLPKLCMLSAMVHQIGQNRELEDQWKLLCTFSD